MNEQVKFVTRYASRDDLVHYKAGQVKFGTLERYRADERLLEEKWRKASQMRLEDDTGEGKEINISSLPDGNRQGKITAPGIVFYGGNFKNTRIVNHIQINDWVFCASTGGYDREHHRLMKKVNPDRDLSNFVVFDAAKLLRALDLYFREQYLLLRYAGNMPYMVASRVNYRDREVYSDISHFNDVDLATISQYDYERVVFSKPLGFRHENEFRIASGLCRPNFAPPGAQAVFPKSALIRKSMHTISEL